MNGHFLHTQYHVERDLIDNHTRSFVVVVVIRHCTHTKKSTNECRREREREREKVFIGIQSNVVVVVVVLSSLLIVGDY